MRNSIYLFILCLLYACSNSVNTKKPVPTHVLTNEETDQEGAFEKWYEQMHQAAPGVNWKTLDENSRWERYAYTLTAKKSEPNQTQEVIVPGKVSGQWNERGSASQSGRIIVSDYDATTNVIYCGSDGGNVWKAHLGSSDWQCLNNSLKFSGVHSLKLIPTTSGKRILASGKASAYYSDDDGQTWNKSTGLSNPASWGYLSKFVVMNDANKTVYLLAQEWLGGAYTTLYRSTDKGQSFTLVSSYSENTYGSTSGFDLWTSVNTSSPVYMANKGTIYSVSSSGTPVLQGTISGITSTSTLLCGTVVNNQTYLYLHNNQTIYKSSNGGVTWSAGISNGKNPFMRNSFACSIKNQNAIFFGDIELNTSSDGGQTWSKTNNWYDYYGSESDKLHADIAGIFPVLDANNNELILIGTDGGVYSSSDLAATVSNTSLANLNSAQYYSTLSGNSKIFAGAQDQGLQFSIGNSQPQLNFSQVISGDFGHLVSSNNGNSLWTVYPSFAAYFPNTSDSSESYWYDFPAGSKYYWMTPIAAVPNHPNKIWVAGGSLNGNGSHLIELTYAATKITAQELGYDFSQGGSGNISAINHSTLNKNYRYILTSAGAFYTSSDSGANWQKSQGLLSLNAHYFYGSCIGVPANTPNVVYAGGSGYSVSPVYRSGNNGTNFTSISTNNGLPNTMVFGLAPTPDDKYVFAATELGPYIYVAADNQWHYLSGLTGPDQVCWSVEYVASEGVARFGTYGRGIWDFKMDQLSTSVAQQKNEHSLNILLNNSEKQILVDSKESEPFRIALYDLNGKAIMNMASNAGNTQTTISTAGLPGGIYILTCLGKKIMQSTKLMITN